MSEKSLVAADILAVAAAAGGAALFMSKELGPKPLFRTRNARRNLFVGLGVVAAIAYGKWVHHHEKNESKKANTWLVIAQSALIFSLASFTLFAKKDWGVPFPFLTSGGGPSAQDVFRAQSKLAALHYLAAITGSYDAQTIAALKRFQADNALLKQDGSINPETLAYLDQAAKQLAASSQQFSPETGYHERITSWT